MCKLTCISNQLIRFLNWVIVIALCLVSPSFADIALDQQLFAAAQRGDSSAIQDAAKRGADVNAFGDRGRTALMVAAMYKQTDAVNTLLSLGAKVKITAKDDTGTTPLMYAVVGGDIGIVKALLAKGADPAAKTKDGKRAIDIAGSQNKQDIVALLKTKTGSGTASAKKSSKPAVDVTAYTGPMVKIPSGEFWMGSHAGDWKAEADEQPQHSVKIRGFKLAQYEVTVQQYAKFVDATGYTGGSSCWQMTKDGSYKDIPGNWRAPGFAQGQLNPVVCVSWDDAQAYVKWLTKVTGQRFRLPSEAEWEYAARAGTDTLWHWGNDPADACRYANGADASGNRMLNRDLKLNWNEALSCDDHAEHNATVGSYAPNAFGLNDMIGNVWEWTQDCWHDSYNGAPSSGSVWTKGGDCSLRVGRGGSWNGDATKLRAASRLRPTTVYRSLNLGFRLAQDL